MLFFISQRERGGGDTGNSRILGISRNLGRDSSIFIDTLLHEATKKCRDARFIYNHCGVYARIARLVWRAFVEYYARLRHRAAIHWKSHPRDQRDRCRTKPAIKELSPVSHISN